MSTLTTIAAGDKIIDSRAVINANFTALNDEKIETSYLDTDTALTANSDTKIPTQKAIKTYIDTSGGANASTTIRGIVEEATDDEIKAGTALGATGARLFINPSSLAVADRKKSVTAGATIAGATLPVPVYQNKTDNEFYACDANDTDKLKFLGFAVTSGTDGSTFNVQFTGIVSGFTGLAEGEKYYVQDAVGTIGTSPGTYEVLVGVAISETELLIQKGKRRASGQTSFSSTTTTAITVGFRPSIVRVFATCSTSAIGSAAASSGGWSVYDGNNCVYVGGDNNYKGISGNDGDNAWNVQPINGTHHGTVTTITDTGFTLSNVEDAGTTVVYIFWEAEGEL